MSKIFQRNENVVLHIPLADESTLGTPLAEARYSVFDLNGKILIDNDVLPLDDVYVGTFSSEVILNIPPFKMGNLPVVEGSPRAFFRVVVNFVAESGFVHRHYDEFYIEDDLVDLDYGINGFSTYGYIMSYAGTRADVSAFIDAEFDCRLSALIQSFEELRSLPLVIERTVSGRGEAYLIIRSIADGTLILTEAEKRDLAIGQLLQANFILGGGAIEERRKQGVISGSSGSASSFYRGGKVLDTPICKDALSKLKPYIRYSVRVGRTA